MGDNLIPFGELTEAEQRKIAQMGGKASGEARRRKKMMREIINTVLAMPLKQGKKCVDIGDVSSYANLKGKNIDVQTGIILAQVTNALKGDLRSAEFIRDTSGQAPVKDVNIAGAVPVVFAGEDSLEDG